MRREIVIGLLAGSAIGSAISVAHRVKKTGGLTVPSLMVASGVAVVVSNLLSRAPEV